MCCRLEAARWEPTNSATPKKERETCAEVKRKKKNRMTSCRGAASASIVRACGHVLLGRGAASNQVGARRDAARSPQERTPAALMPRVVRRGVCCSADDPFWPLDGAVKFRVCPRPRVCPLDSSVLFQGCAHRPCCSLLRVRQHHSSTIFFSVADLAELHMRANEMLRCSKILWTWL